MNAGDSLPCSRVRASIPGAGWAHLPGDAGALQLHHFQALLFVFCTRNGHSMLGEQRGKDAHPCSALLGGLSSISCPGQGALGPPGVPTRQDTPEGPWLGLRGDAALVLRELEGGLGDN